MRDACIQDPGAFHGDIAAKTLHWFDPASHSWLSQNTKGTKDTNGNWHGWKIQEPKEKQSGIQSTQKSSWTPWNLAFDDSDAPFYRWFFGAKTNAAFNEVDRHVLNGYGSEVAFDYEGDRWNPSLNNGRGGPVYHQQITRRQLLTQSVIAAQALKNLGLEMGDRIAINMPNTLDQIIWTQAAKRLGIIYTPVFGGFSDKTLSDRIENAGAKIVITTDGASRNAETVAFKESYTDPALDRYIGTQVAYTLIENTLRDLTADGDRNRDDGNTSAILKTNILTHLEKSIGNEITLSRADIMAEIGKVLNKAKLNSDSTVAWRTSLAEALANSPPRVSTVIVVRHVDLKDIAWNPQRDIWADHLLASAQQQVLSQAGLQNPSQLDALSDLDLVNALWQSVPPVAVDADFPLFIIYTSGSTGKPKGVVHVHGGYLSGITHTMKVSFDAVPGQDRIWVVADPGWITGQSYLISASLAARIPGIITEGAPVFPNAGRFSSIIERYQVTIFKAGVTFLKAIMSNAQNRADVEQYDMRSLKVATFCAEPTSPSVQQFGMELVTPQYINSYWATEHGGIVWTHPYGNVDQPLRADAHTYPLPWVLGDIWIAEESQDHTDKENKKVKEDKKRSRYRSADLEEKGEIVITRPYPYLARTIGGDADNVGCADWRGDIQRFTDTYFGRFKDADDNPVYAYLQGDFAKRYADGSFSLHGRSDDVINVSGHRLGTEEIEGAILKDKHINPDSNVGNCIVIGAPHREKGLTPLAFLLPAAGKHISKDDERRLQNLVREEKGQVAVPSDFICLSAFPETRSGKYMRRFLSVMVQNEDDQNEKLGDISTLRNPECLDEIRSAIKKWQHRQTLAHQQSITESLKTLRIQYDPIWDPAIHKHDMARRIVTITISNPPVNALSERVLDELKTTLSHINRRQDVAAVVIAGQGSNTFVAGADVRQLLEEVHDSHAARALPSKAHAVAHLIETMEKPVIAAIEGVALGGGCELALACHWRVGNAQSQLGQPEINLYLPPGYGGTQRLARIMMQADDNISENPGLLNALKLLLSGRSIDGKNAAEQGLLNELAEPGCNVLTAAQSRASEAVLSEKGLAKLAMQARHQSLQHWNQKSRFLSEALNEVLDDHYIQTCLTAHTNSGRRKVADTIIQLVQQGFETGFQKGLEAEINAFSHYLLDEENGGKKGIRLFLDKQSPALPSRSRLAPTQKKSLIQQGDLLPIGSPFIPGITPLPPFQLAFAVVRDAQSGAYLHGDPITAEAEVILPTPTPNANQALIYVLASEVNYNDIWAITGIPVSLFDDHDEDIHVTGSGGVGIVVGLGSALQLEGRLAIGKMIMIYSGVSDLLDPSSGNDPMFTDFHIQGYQSPEGSHQQFMLADGPQCLTPPADLNLETSASFALPGGTAYRALFKALAIGQGDRLFVEGAVSGTGAWSVALAQAMNAHVTGLVSSAERHKALNAQGVNAIDRKATGIAEAFTKVPENPKQWANWEAQGDEFLAEIRRLNQGELCSHSLSHAGETAFPRSFQALESGGAITFFGASSGYQMTFMGKPGIATAQSMLRKAAVTPGQTAVLFYGANEKRDLSALAAIEAARAAALRIVVITDTDAERDFILSLGYGDAILGGISLEELKRRHPHFHWPTTMPTLPDPESPAFKEAIRNINENTLKPVGSAVGKLLRSADNPRGQPDIIIERAHRDSLFASTMLIKPNTGIVLYTGDMSRRRYSFYAPQVWMRQRKILMPSASIIGTHLCNAAEVMGLTQMINAGKVQVPPPYLGSWEDTPMLHQAMWENRLPEATDGAAKAVINHALPAGGLKTLEELLSEWSALL